VTFGNLDLLGERRTQRGEPDPDSSDPLVPLMQGAVLGGALVLVALLASGLMLLFNRATEAEVARLDEVQGRFDTLQGRIKEQRSQRQRIERASTDLARALVAVRSGSALMEDLRRRTPLGIQLTNARVDGQKLLLKGQAVGPSAFERINALELGLQGSPLLDPSKIQLIKASREELKTQPPPGAPIPLGPVAFELSASFSPAGRVSELTALRLLGADGMAARLQQLQRQGVLR